LIDFNPFKTLKVTDDDYVLTKDLKIFSLLQLLTKLRLHISHIS